MLKDWKEEDASKKELLLKKLPGLKRPFIGVLTGLPKKMLQEVLDSLTDNMEELDLSKYQNHSLPKLGRFKNLKILILADSPKLNNLSHIIDVESLERVVLKGCPNLKNIEPIMHLKNLKHFDMRKCEKLDGQHFQLLKQFQGDWGKLVIHHDIRNLS